MRPRRFSHHTLIPMQTTRSFGWFMVCCVADILFEKGLGEQLSRLKYLWIEGASYPRAGVIHDTVALHALSCTPSLVSSSDARAWCTASESNSSLMQYLMLHAADSTTGWCERVEVNALCCLAVHWTGATRQFSRLEGRVCDRMLTQWCHQLTQFRHS
jgi:hypothetical protein